MHTKKNPLRFSFVFLFFIACLLFFSVKLIFIQVFKSAYLAKLAEKQHNHCVRLDPNRGTIYDRNFRPLALNVSTFSLYAQPRLMKKEDKEKAFKRLPDVLVLDSKSLQDKLSKDKYFVWIARKLSLQQVNVIKALKIHGLDFVKESKRYYPNQALAAHLIGFAGIDNVGLEGIELKYDHYLKGEYGWSQVLRDAKQQSLLIEKGFIPPKNGFDIVLTIDETIQYLAERALDKAFEKHNAKGASIVVMNPKTGEILAMANRPTFDLTHASSSNMESRRNRAVTDTYEPGSVFKIVTAAAALEEEKFSEEDKIFCENGSYKIGNHTLHDHHGSGTLTFSQVIERSSNIGVAKIAQKLGAATVYKYAKLFRFGTPTQIELLGEVAGTVKPPSVWSKTSIGAIPIGQEVTVTALQLAGAISAVANDGVYMQPFVIRYIQDQSGEIIKSFEPREISKVISKNTAQRLKKILSGVVVSGTGKLAQLENISSAGKTGTSQKVVNGIYSHDQFFASFIGFAPVEDPQLAIVVVVDDPHPSYYGGTVAAPVFKEVAENSIRYLNVSRGMEKEFVRLNNIKNQ